MGGDSFREYALLIKMFVTKKKKSQYQAVEHLLKKNLHTITKHRNLKMQTI